MVGTAYGDEVQYDLGTKATQVKPRPKGGVVVIRREPLSGDAEAFMEMRRVHPNYFTEDTRVNAQRDRAYRQLAEHFTGSPLRHSLFDHLGSHPAGGVILDEIAEQPLAAHYVSSKIDSKFGSPQKSLDYQPKPEVARAAEALAETVYKAHQEMNKPRSNYAR